MMFGRKRPPGGDAHSGEHHRFLCSYYVFPVTFIPLY